jgi:hypothetical protein
LKEAFGPSGFALFALSRLHEALDRPDLWVEFGNIL